MPFCQPIGNRSDFPYNFSIHKFRAHGGSGAANLAKAVVEACKKPSKFEFLFPLDMPVKEKIEVCFYIYILFANRYIREFVVRFMEPLE
jgi:formyltetrahydrofolate synthetase